MSKWINTTTGQEVPSNEVRELTTGSGLFVHETTVSQRKILRVPGRSGYEITVSETPMTTKLVDGYAVRIGDNETYDPAVHNITNQVLAAQAIHRQKGRLSCLAVVRRCR